MLLTLHLDDILNINNIYFDTMVSQIYPSELHFNNVKPLIPNPLFLTYICKISNDIVSTKIYDKRDDLISKLSISHF